MNSAINIGVEKCTVEAAHKAIIDILSMNRAEQVTITALQALESVCSVNGSTISNCVFKVDKDEKDSV